MRKNTFRLLLALAMIALIGFAVSPASAQGPDNSGQSVPVTGNTGGLPLNSQMNQASAINSGALVTIAPNSALWYRFDYSGDKSQIVINLQSDQILGLNFKVYTPEEVQNIGSQDVAIGQGTVQQGSCQTISNPNQSCVNLPGLFWAGRFNAGGTYLVLVTNSSQDFRSFSLTITGSGVGGGQQSMNTQTMQQTSNGQGIPVTGAAPSSPNMGSSKDMALPINNVSTVIPANSSVWYKFDYAGDQQQVILNLLTNNIAGMDFKVIDTNGNTIGRGTVQNFNGSALAGLLWSGNFNVGGTYFVQVINNNDSDVMAQLVMTLGGFPNGQQ